MAELLGGTEALVRLLLTQATRDRAAGLRTAGFVSGYRGSPLGGLDMELWRAAEALSAADIRFTPGLNEDLAATSVWGTQQLAQLGPARVDGVFALWYGKGPGVDRSGDALRHGNAYGASAKGGVLVAFGDDHPGKSSTVSHQSEPLLAALSIPSLSPSGVDEIVPMGLLGWALSRYTRLWVGLKIVNETAETTRSVILPDPAMAIALPDHGRSAELGPRLAYAPLADEMAVARVKLPLVHRFADANRIDRLALGDEAAALGIVAHGRGFEDARHALDLLGIDGDRARALGLALFKVGLVWPLSPAPIRAFAIGKRALLVVEEKRAFVEPQVAHALANISGDRPILFGKADEAGRPLLPADAPLDPVTVALAIADRIESLGLADEALRDRARALAQRAERQRTTAPAPHNRLPYFCSGCPHNSSTKVPEGSAALSGIGCHGMAIWMKRDTLKSVQMGGEGANWIGAAPFVERGHVFQNLGDGTYSHSGLLAIRAAVQAGVNITYKVLCNAAVAMTGGQPVEGTPSAGQIARQVLAQDVAACVIVTEEPQRIAAPAGVAVYHRRELDAVQRRLAAIPGVTILIYDQQCATEARRLRKRGRQPTPARRAYIHPGVCEGCGDCSVQSNCVSLTPLPTAFGVKRAIDQGSCNQDLSCVEGFCPSFVTIEGATLQPSTGPADDALETRLAAVPERPAAALSSPMAILVAGVGGTGVVTLAQAIAAAADDDGLLASGFNMTGLAQKGGAVWSHVRLAPADGRLGPARLATGEASLVIGCDLVAAASAETRQSVDAEAGRIVHDVRASPSGELQTDRDHRIDEPRLRSLVEVAAPEVVGIEAHEAAVALLGEPLGANALLLGHAQQKGWLPVSLGSLRRAIGRGPGAAMNLRALALGRLAAHDPAAFSALLPTPPKLPETLEEVIAHRRAHLTAYQDARLADEYETVVRATAAAEAVALPGSDALALAVARGYAKLLAYKDEYEVARQLSDPGFHDGLRGRFGDGVRIGFHLAPPALGAGADGARPRKRRFGPAMLPTLRTLARLRGLRGTPFDPFGLTQERREERRLAAEYRRDLLERVLPSLDAAGHARAVAWARLPDDIRGFGPVKAAAIAAVRPRWQAALAGLTSR